MITKILVKASKTRLPNMNRTEFQTVTLDPNKELIRTPMVASTQITEPISNALMWKEFCIMCLC